MPKKIHLYKKSYSYLRQDVEAWNTRLEKCLKDNIFSKNWNNSVELSNICRFSIV